MDQRTEQGGDGRIDRVEEQKRCERTDGERNNRRERKNFALLYLILKMQNFSLPIFFPPRPNYPDSREFSSYLVCFRNS